jgi:hypothetical protein
VAREAVRDVLQHDREVPVGPLDRAEHHDQQSRGGRRDRSALRVRRRRTEGPVVVGQQQAPGQVHPLLADPRVALSLASGPRLHRSPHVLAVVQAEGELALERTQVADVHRQVHPGQALALHHAAQQRFAARAGLGGIHAEPVEQRAGLGDPGDAGRRPVGVLALETRADLRAFLVELARHRLHPDVLGREQTQGEHAAQRGLHGKAQVGCVRLHSHRGHSGDGPRGSGPLAKRYLKTGARGADGDRVPRRAPVELLLTTEWAAGNPFPTQQVGRRCRPRCGLTSLSSPPTRNPDIE